MGLKSMHAEKQREQSQQNEQENSLIEQQAQKIAELESRISELSSINSMLKNENQKRSEMIKSLNEKIGKLSESDNVLKLNEKLRIENEKLKQDKYNTEEKTEATILAVENDYIQKCNELKKKEANVEALKSNLKAKIREEGDRLIASKIMIMQEEQERQRAFFIAHKFIILLITIDAFSVKLFTALRSEALFGDFKTFFATVVYFIVLCIDKLILAGKWASKLGDMISNPILSAITHWLLQIGVSFGIALGSITLIIIITDKGIKWFKENQADWINMAVAFESLTILIFGADKIKHVLPINLILLFLLIQILATGIRAFIQKHRHRKSGVRF